MSTVNRNDNVITIQRMDHPVVVSDFIKSIGDGNSRGYKDFIIQFSPNVRAFPDVCAPISGILDFYRIKGIDFEVIYPDGDTYFRNTHFDSPMTVSDNIERLRQSSLDCVWRFHDSADVNRLVDSIIESISQRATCEPGVLQSLEWSFNEVMDNVLQHSDNHWGYVMGQIHPKQRRVAFCVYDYGMGIFNSLKNSKHAPRYPLDAITLAIREGVTRDSNIGQGNGLWGLHKIVSANQGSIAITSSGAVYRLEADEVKTIPRTPYLSKKIGATTIDFQIDYCKGISVSEALGGHSPVNLRHETMENEKGNLVYPLAEKASGTGTRQSGERIRTEIINLQNDSKSVIEIDFHDVAVVSSSFADELVGKLVTHYGFGGFGQVIRLKNMNSTVEVLVNRSVAQRMAQSLTIDFNDQ